jgi:hypothetical protein
MRARFDRAEVEQLRALLAGCVAALSDGEIR